jgi:hypothetical protein
MVTEGLRMLNGVGTGEQGRNQVMSVGLDNLSQLLTPPDILRTECRAAHTEQAVYLAIRIRSADQHNRYWYIHP